MKIQSINIDTAMELAKKSDQRTVFSDSGFQSVFAPIEYFVVSSGGEELAVIPKLSNENFLQFNSMLFLGESYGDTRTYFNIVGCFLENAKVQNWNKKVGVSLHRSLWDIRPFSWYSWPEVMPRAKYCSEIKRNCLKVTDAAEGNFFGSSRSELSEAWQKRFGEVSDVVRFRSLISGFDLLPNFEFLCFESKEGKVNIGLLRSEFEKKYYLIFYVSSKSRNSNLNKSAMNAIVLYCFSKSMSLDLLGTNSKGTSFWKRGLGASSYLFFG